MTAFNAEQINEYAQKVVDGVGPTLELEDLRVVVPTIMEIVEQTKAMTKEEKHESALNMLRYVLGNTDTPWLPDGVTDPLFLKLADMVLIPVIAEAAKGKWAINASAKGESSA